MKIKKQTDIKDCGLLVLQAIYKYFYNKWLNINFLKQKVNFGLKGINIDNLINLGKKINIELVSYKSDINNIINYLKNQYIITIFNNNGIKHYVICKFSFNKFIIWDSNIGKYKLTKAEFQKKFSNIIITIKKHFYKPLKINLKSPFQYFSKKYNILILIFIFLCLNIILTFICGLFLKIILDKIIPNNLKETLFLVSFIFLILNFLLVLNQWLKTFFLKKINILIQKDLSWNYINKMYQSSFNDLNKLTINDHLRRISLIDTISSFLSNAIFICLHDLLIFIFSIALLMIISIKLFAIALLIGFLILLINFFLKSFLNTKYDSLIKQQLKLFNSFVDNISLYSEISNLYLQNYMKKQFEKKYNKLEKNEYSIWNLKNWKTLLENILISSSQILIIYFSVINIWNNIFFVGSMILFLSFYNNFIYSLKNLSNFFLNFKQQKKYFDLVSFVLDLPQKNINNKNICLLKIQKIEIKKAKIGYDKVILKINNLIIDKSMQIEGFNGSGKTTLLETISTKLFFKGIFKFNDIPYNNLNIENIRNKIAYVSPKNFIFNCTIIDFITLNNPQAIKTFNDNFLKYKLIKILENLNISLDLSLINNGQNLSSGQRQIILILRLFAFSYDLIILDEIFENIDLKNFEILKKNLKDFQKSIFLEVSHSQKYLFNKERIKIENFY